MSTQQLEEARLSRSHPSVLKARVIAIRSSDRDSWICIYEGIEDVGVYEQWLRAIDQTFAYRPLPANGKDQLLSFRANANNTRDSYVTKLLYFVDRDFDYLKGSADGPDIFCTSTYSIENYLVDEQAVRSIVNDELRGAATGESTDAAVEEFRRTYDAFLTAMRDVNLRIFAARTGGTRIQSIEDRAHKYVTIALANVTRLYTEADLDTLIPISQGHALTIDDRVRTTFNSLNARTDYRGKFAIGFFQTWLELISKDRRAQTPQLFRQPIMRLGYSPATSSMRSLAARTAVPAELRKFLEQAIRKQRPRRLSTACMCFFRAVRQWTTRWPKD